MLFCTWGQMTFLMQEPIKILSPKVLNSIAKECVQFGVKNLFVSTVTVNTRRSPQFDAIDT